MGVCIYIWNAQAAALETRDVMHHAVHYVMHCVMHYGMHYAMHYAMHRLLDEVLLLAPVARTHERHL